MIDSIANEVIFSWEGGKVNGKPVFFPPRIGNYRAAGPAKNLFNHQKNKKRFGMSRKAWRRALSLARGTMNEKHVEELLKRVNLNA